MPPSFKDHFSGNSDAYSEFRPVYPDELYSYLSSLCTAHDRAWDCATGTGQAAVGLSSYFSEVIATDASATQIDSATKNNNITYRVASAENSGIENNSIDLITVAQAVHWFDLNRFRKEVDRVLKPGGVIAVWSYGLLAINDDIDRVINNLYGPVLEDYWPKERRFIEEGYRNVEFPYEKIKSPQFVMSTNWELSQLIGYLSTWSAVKEYITQQGINPLEEIYKELRGVWGNESKTYSVQWPLNLLVWQKNGDE